MEKELLTAKEVAAYLNINEKMVYRLVREGRLPGTRITGKWTFSRELVKDWIASHSISESLPPPLSSGGVTLSGAGSLLIAGSNDLVVERMQAYLVRRLAPELLTYTVNTGSLGGINALRLKKAHMAGVHLYHAPTGEYNMPYLRELLPKDEPVVFHLALRNQGLIVGPRFSAIIGGVEDISGSGARLINREPGSGTRLLLDRLFAENHCDPKRIPGYSNEVLTHREVGLAIMRSEADVGLGIESVARSFSLDFVPVTTESYDLVVPKENLSTRGVQVFLNLLHSSTFRRLTRGLAGYDLKQAGTMIA